MAKDTEKRTGYKSNVVYSSKELNPIEKYKVADVSDAVQLVDLVKDGAVVIDFDYYAVVEIENPKSKQDKEYTKYVVFDKAGTKYVTGSESFASELENILSQLGGVDGWQLKIFKLPSKNYNGEFVTCTVE